MRVLQHCNVSLVFLMIVYEFCIVTTTVRVDAAKIYVSLLQIKAIGACVQQFTLVGGQWMDGIFVDA